MSDMKTLLESVPQTGQVEWIGVASERRAEVQPLTEAVVEMNVGLSEDHHARSGKSERQVTLIQQEHLDVVAKLIGLDANVLPCRGSSPHPSSLRRAVSPGGHPHSARV